MDYKEKVIALLNDQELSKEQKEKLENIFPELKESEDERIRKELIEQVAYIIPNDDELDDELNTLPTYQKRIDKYRAWLEKQGEKKPNSQLKKCLKCQFNFTGYCNGTCILENNEQKPADNIEPKFNVGDWITTTDEEGNVTTEKIIEFWGDKVRLIDINGFYSLWPKHELNYYHLWTIQDAKDGDVLATENFIFIFKNIDDGNGVHYYCQYEISKHENDNQFDIALPQSLMGRVGNSISHYSPATKEQRDLLFRKMKEAGYEWDADKKELKKIEPEFEGDNILSTLGNNQVQDILEDMGLLDDNGRCPHTAEEIFKAGMEHAFNLNREAASSVKLDAKNR